MEALEYLTSKNIKSNYKNKEISKSKSVAKFGSIESRAPKSYLKKKTTRERNSEEIIKLNKEKGKKKKLKKKPKITLI